MSVKPPRGSGRVRLVEIEGIDLQPCGGTHVRRTGEIGTVAVTDIEKKGKQNRRVRMALAGLMPYPQADCQDMTAHFRLARAPAGAPGRSECRHRRWLLVLCPRRTGTPKPSILPGTFRARFASIIDSVKDSSSPLPHMLPSPDEFARRVGAMGIGEDTIIVVYDGLGPILRPARPLDVPGFRRERRQDPRRRFSGLESRGPPGRKRSRTKASPPNVFTAHIDAILVADAERVRARIEIARRTGGRRPARRSVSAARRRSRVPGLRSGHIPGQLNLPFATIIENGKLKDKASIERAVDGGRNRPGTSGDHELRLRRVSSDPVARAGNDRPSRRCALRRLVGRMGSPRRPAGRDRKWPSKLIWRSSRHPSRFLKDEVWDNSNLPHAKERPLPSVLMPRRAQPVSKHATPLVGPSRRRFTAPQDERE